MVGSLVGLLAGGRWLLIYFGIIFSMNVCVLLRPLLWQCCFVTLGLSSIIFIILNALGFLVILDLQFNSDHSIPETLDIFRNYLQILSNISAKLWCNMEMTDFSYITNTNFSLYLN